MKSKMLLFVIALFAMTQAMAQNTLIDRAGVASFFSEAPMEDIEAVNKEVLGAIDLEKGTLAVSMFIKGFHFDKSLMEEHFNENYLESEKYPKATFKGKITDYANLDLTKTGTYTAEADGEMEIHGVKKPLKTRVEFKVTASTIEAKTAFEISVAEHDIEIPTLVIKNIAEFVDVKASFKFAR
ncbi:MULTISPECIES: YceI family protein [Reichenbachiella]|uniref:YceI-like domain-containing protein n=1 Tax=Reichenbachiella agariperforans TaxID=156994 RepID=A0A1M6JNT0_REIAG|nr:MULTISPECIES: YceI family protein [Reichenbachiella]MBU2913268.1 YceI family protein [Reichenbachiella agariperforans]RJE74742.1 hypothetical protein BGP76_16550 [Reichenbachiella sp. MSK19-1]SHJ48302.1 YceI-like domain-containing protein [Reichenbachiella agariperforans]